jgi:NADP-reducing hydrogenase subunit HndD
VTEGFSRIDQELCTGCGNCVSTCPAEAITGERHKPHVISEERCVGCGRCVQVCSAYDTVFEEHATSRAKRLAERALPAGLAEPLFAAYDRCCISEVRQALADSSRFAVAQCGPAVFGAVAEDFGLAAGSVPPGRIVAALKKIGFKKVYDFSLPAAIAVLEEAHELIHRLQTGGTLPLINSSCPAAVKFIEQFHPELIHYLAGCKSPAMISGALLKSQVATAVKLNASQVYSVSIGPCTSRKFEAGRPELSTGGLRHVDAVLTTRELAYIIKDSGIDLSRIREEAFDTELTPVPGMENVYCSPSDISESVLRAGYSLLQKRPEGSLDVKFEESGSEGVRIASVQLGEFKIKAAAVTGLTSANPFFDAIKSGKNEIAFIELLACPLGCVSGGGQPKVLLPQDKAGVYATRAGINSGGDAKSRETIEQSPTVQKIYKECFAKSPGDKSNRALHTQYQERRIGDPGSAGVPPASRQ